MGLVPEIDGHEEHEATHTDALFAKDRARVNRFLAEKQDADLTDQEREELDALDMQLEALKREESFAREELELAHEEVERASAQVDVIKGKLGELRVRRIDHARRARLFRGRVAARART